MAQETKLEVGFWERIDRMRREIFSEEDLELLEAIKPMDRLEEQLARL